MARKKSEHEKRLAGTTRRDRAPKPVPQPPGWVQKSKRAFSAWAKFCVAYGIPHRFTDEPPGPPEARNPFEIHLPENRPEPALRNGRKHE